MDPDEWEYLTEGGANIVFKYIGEKVSLVWSNITMIILIYFILGGLSMLSAKLLRDLVSGPIKKPSKKGRGKYR